jgi:hypothetical protein
MHFSQLTCQIFVCGMLHSSEGSVQVLRSVALLCRVGVGEGSGWKSVISDGIRQRTMNVGFGKVKGSGRS